MSNNLQNGPISSLNKRVVIYSLATLIIHIFAALLTRRYYMYVGFAGMSPFADAELYFDFARTIFSGLVPYRDFAVEYPPFALPLFLIPYSVVGLIPQIPAQLVFMRMFAAEMLLLDAIIIYVMAQHVARTQAVSAVPKALAYYTAYFLVFCPIVITRFDLAPTMAAFVAAIWYSRNKWISGSIMAGAGVLMKLIPGLVLLPVWTGSNKVRSKVMATVILGLTVTFGIGVCWSFAGEKFLDSVRYHTGRGLEIHSGYASMFMVISAVTGLCIGTDFNHSSMNLIASGSAAVAKFSVIVQGFSFLLVLYQAHRWKQPYSISLATAALVAYIITGKVLSPQYLIWLMPFFAVLGTGQRLFFVCCVLTTMIWPWYAINLARYETFPVIILTSRNLLLIWLFFQLLMFRDPQANASDQLQSD